MKSYCLCFNAFIVQIGIIHTSNSPGAIRLHMVHTKMPSNSKYIK